MRRTVLLVVLQLLCLTTAAGAQELLPLLDVQPIQVFHLRPEGMELSVPPPPGSWRFAVTWNYGNSWASTHQIPDAHISLDPPGSPLSRNAVAAAEAAWPGETSFFIDTELQRLEVEAVWSPASGWSVGAGLPWLVWDGTTLDVIPDHLHEFMGVSRGLRPYFPTRQSVVYVATGTRSFFLDRPPQAGQGSLHLWVAREIGRSGSWSHRFVLAVKAPTAKVTELGGDAWDWGARWAVRGKAGPLTLDAGLGWSRLGGGAPTIDRATDAWHLWSAARIHLFGGVDAAVIVRGDTSVYWHQAAGRLTKASLEMGFGPVIRLGEHVDLALTFGENLPAIGLAPDFSLHAGIVWRTDPAGS